LYSRTRSTVKEQQQMQASSVLVCFECVLHQRPKALVQSRVEPLETNPSLTPAQPLQYAGRSFIMMRGPSRLIPTTLQVAVSRICTTVRRSAARWPSDHGERNAEFANSQRCRRTSASSTDAAHPPATAQSVHSAARDEHRAIARRRTRGRRACRQLGFL
jgi:hypothetical protein